MSNPEIKTQEEGKNEILRDNVCKNSFKILLTNLHIILKTDRSDKKKL